MNKIPTVFVRDDHDRRFVTRQVTPGCEWVFEDKAAVATQKYDGTCVMLDDSGQWWARREVKPGKVAPPEFRPVQADGATGKTVGWEPMAQSGFLRWHEEAVAAGLYDFEAGTYELIGPKVNGNPEGAKEHQLVRHADADVLQVPLDFDWLEIWLRLHPFEGIVWHHPDGRMAKLKARDFPGDPGDPERAMTSALRLLSKSALSLLRELNFLLLAGSASADAGVEELRRAGLTVANGNGGWSITALGQSVREAAVRAAEQP